MKQVYYLYNIKFKQSQNIIQHIQHIQQSKDVKRKNIFAYIFDFQYDINIPYTNCIRTKNKLFIISQLCKITIISLHISIHCIQHNNGYNEHKSNIPQHLLTIKCIRMPNKARQYFIIRYILWDRLDYQSSTIFLTKLTINNQISISNITITTTYSSFDILFRTSTAKYAATTTLQFLFYNSTSSNIISNNSQLVQIQIAPFQSSTLSSNSTITGAASTYTIEFTPLVQIQANSIIQLQFDAWGPYLASNFGAATALNVCNGQCTISLVKDYAIQFLMYSGLYPSASTSKRTIILLNARNPSSFNPLNLKITVLANDGTSVYMSGTTTFSATVTNTFGSVTFNTPDKTISTLNNNINLRLAPKNPIGSNTYLRIITHSDISLSYIFNTNNLLTIPNQLPNQGSSQILLGNLTRNTSTSQPTLLSLTNFFLTNPPYGQKSVTITFRTEQLIKSVYYHMQESVIQITAIASNIQQYGVKAIVENIGSVTSYNLWFVNVNKLITNSIVYILFPSDIILNTTDSLCNLTTSSIVSTCSIINKTTIKIIMNSVISPATNLTISVTKVTNPYTTIPTSSFVIKTYYMDQSSLVDQLTSNFRFTAKQVPLRAVILTSSSLIVSSISTYTFTIQPSYPIPSSSKLRLTIPNQISNPSSIMLSSFVINNTTISGCSFILIMGNVLEFSNLCINVIVGNTSTVKIVLINVTNPNSFKPTDSFIIEVYNPSNLRQEYLNSGVYVTMNQTAKITYFKITPTSLYTNDNTDYTFQINFIIKHFSGDRILLKFPSQTPLNDIYQCQSLTTNLSISCSKINQNTLVFTMNYNSTIYSNSIKFTVSNFTNFWYSSTKTFTIQTTTNDTTYYYQEDAQAIVNYIPKKIGVSINNDNNIILLGNSKITLTITSPYVMNKATDYSLFYLLIQIPTDLTPINKTCISSYASSICSQPSTQTLNITSLSDLSSSFTIKFTSNTSYFESSSSFDIKLFYSSSIVLSNLQTKLSKFCIQPCKQCTTIAKQCLSCLPSPYSTFNTYFQFNSSCVNSCPDTYYLNNSINSCGKCNNANCYTCVNGPDQCTACTTGKFLYNKTCLLICPNSYYGYNKQCLKCQSPCNTCNTTAATCNTCVTSYYLDIGTNNLTCVQTCTNTNYIGIDGKCKQCTSNCKTCSKILSNCTSCDQTNFQLYNFSCIRSCPTGMYSSSTGSCLNCESPCQTCSSKIICESCVKGYYLYNKTQCTSQCPNGFIQVVSECVSCNLKCATCSITTSNCTSCPSGTYFYQNDCITQCPPLTYPYNKTCTRCISPCVTCSNSPQVCLSCIQNLLLLNSTCVQSCPLSGYIKQQSICVPCPANCITCSTSINCTLCNNENYLLQGSCVSTCPTSNPIVQNRQCYPCADVCLTCREIKDNCTQCKVNMFKFTYTCVASCPLGYYSNMQTYQCEDGLSSKIVFFPILIISIIIIFFTLISRFFSPLSSLPTSLASFLSVSQLSIWIYLLIQLTQPFKQLDIDYILPITLTVLAISCIVIINVLFFCLEYKKMENDDYVRGWASNNVNYTVLVCVRYTGLIVMFKFFRLVYSRFLHMRTLSLPFKKAQNIFPLTTIFSIICLILCQIPIIIASFSLVYKKLIKDQLFYTSIQCLLLTIFTSIITLIDIYKPDDYFSQSDYVKTRRYLQKIKDASFNKLEDNFQISKQEGSLDGEKYQSKTGGKFIFTKRDPESLKQLFFQEAGSTITDAHQTIDSKDKQLKSYRNKKKINIFDPIKQQDQELYDDLKYSEEEIKTLLQMENQRKLSSNVHKEQQYTKNYSQQKKQRGKSLGIHTDSDWDDNKSVIQGRKLKSKWNNIISHRQKLAKSIFNTFDHLDSNQLQNIIQPILQDQYDDQQNQKRQENPFKSIQYGKTKKNRKRKKKVVNHQGNSELEKIYLQRLTEKKNKQFNIETHNIKYDF